MHLSNDREISCRITRTLLMYLREKNNDSLGPLLKGLAHDERYLQDTNNWVSHAFLKVLYDRMIHILGDEKTIYEMALASGRFQSLGLLDKMVRLLGNPKLIYTQAPKYNKLMKANGDVFIHEIGDSWVILEDRYHDATQKNHYDCDYTRGILAGIPTLFGMPLAQVEEVECQVKPEIYGDRTWPDTPSYGSRGCLYRVRWDPASRPALWKRVLGRYSAYRKAIDELQEANRIIQEKYDEVKKLAFDLETTNKQLMESKSQLESSMLELKTSELRYRLLAENVTDTIWTMDLKLLRFTYISPSVLKMRGFTVEEAMALNLEETLPPASLEEVANVLAEELARETDRSADPERSRTIEVQQYCKDGSTDWAEVTTSFIRDETGSPVGLLGVTRDISERKRAEQLYKAKIVADASNKAKSEFLSNMSHEFRTPLNHIMGFTELVLDQHFGSLNNVQEEYLTDVHQSSKHLLSLVNEILDLSKIESGKLDLKLSEINLKQMLEQSLSIISEKALKQKIQISANLEKIPGFITADELRLNQILYNLLSNAVKFTAENGSISLKARAITEAPDEGSGQTDGCCREVEISVKDTGIGIHKDDMGCIFEPFAQVENEQTRKHRGTGLGLTLTRKLVEMHGGRIWAESEGPGNGTTFCFRLPI
jgi:PAS domain S-box-containing protein